MVQGDIVKRSWSKNSQISEHNDILDIWDTGSHIYERWPNGDEFYWKIISRDISDNGFTEVLEQQATWQAPGKVVRKEQIPLLRHSGSQFQLGTWNVEQHLEKSSTLTHVDVNRKSSYSHGKGPRAPRESGKRK